MMCAREARAHHEQMHVDQLAGQPDLRLAPIDLGLDTRDQRHEHLADVAQLTPTTTHVAADLPRRHLGAVVGDQPLPDPPGGVTLLAGDPLRPVRRSRRIGPFGAANEQARCWRNTRGIWPAVVPQ